jgi:hypothetical protein
LRKVEQEKNSVLKDYTIQSWVASKGHKGFLDNNQSKRISGLGDTGIRDSQNMDSLKAIKIMNVDWYDTEIRRNIENKGFDVNSICLKNFNEIHENFKLNESEIQPLFASENSEKQQESGTDRIKDYINTILESKTDWLIKFNEIDAMLKLIKDRFHDFKRSPYLEEFFKSASFTLYILTLSLHLPDIHFFRVVAKYDEITYENTIKLIIRWKIFYEARETIASIIKMINEREYTAALIQTEVALLDSWEEEANDDVTIKNIKKNLKTLYDQSSYIEEKIEKLREVNPFNRPFLYKGDDYLTTMKQYRGMLDKVLEVHEIK